MKKRLMHTQRGPATLELDMAAGSVEVTTENRDYAEILLEPMRDGDQVAEDLIARTQHGSRSAIHSVRIPHPEPTNLSGNGIQFVSGNVVVSSGDITIVNGRVVGGTGTVQHVANAGGVRVLARMPHGSSVTATTISADVIARSPLHEVRFRSTSGDLDAREVGLLNVRSISGDISVQRLSGRNADVESTSGDIDIHTVCPSEITARSISGDIRITAPAGITVHSNTNTVSGKVRTPAPSGVA